MKAVSCNVCGSDEFKVVFEKSPERRVHHRIVQCQQCQLLYANPQEVIDCEDMAREGGSEEFDDNCSYFVKQRVQIPDNLRALNILNQWYPKRGRLLEVGCCTGLFLNHVRDAGWDTVGLEPHQALARHAEKKFQLKVIPEVLPQPNLPSGSFDAVIMLHVIEHMPDPLSSVRELRRLLRPGGTLVIETPRFDSLSFKLLKSRERSISNCSGHIYFFSVPTLRRLVEQAGFEVARTELVGRTLTMDRFLFNVGLVTGHDGTQRFITNVSNRLKLERFRFHVNVRDMQRIYCRAA